MPLGWYLAQGFYPLGPSSSDDEEGPCELPDGRIVCGPHGLVVCGKCCTDYTDMDNVPDGYEEYDDEGDDEEDDGGKSDDEKSVDYTRAAHVRAFWRDVVVPDMKRGTGREFPTKFTPPNSTTTPTQLFPVKAIDANSTRYVNRHDPHVVLVFTDGACLNNGQPDPKAGWAFVYGSEDAGKLATRSGRLETEGPFGDKSIQSSNRAELRAVIAALRFRYWPNEGFSTIVIATDSEYVVEGSTTWAKTWIKKGWKTSGGVEVKNQDLWELLLGEVERWKEDGLSIRFWRIQRDWNQTADAAAKEAASEDKVPNQWNEPRFSRKGPLEI
ncbi:ribonuclease H-like protein [Rostrohypoxylon terebratum]|nr:ribonuclease H-like protein [Rostrohypoxylon terebratum]